MAGLIMPAVLVALALTFTRSAWVGACAAFSVLLMIGTADCWPPAGARGDLHRRRARLA